MSDIRPFHRRPGRARRGVRRTLREARAGHGRSRRRTRRHADDRRAARRQQGRGQPRGRAPPSLRMRGRLAVLALDGSQRPRPRAICSRIRRRQQRGIRRDRRAAFAGSARCLARPRQRGAAHGAPQRLRACDRTWAAERAGARRGAAAFDLALAAATNAASLLVADANGWASSRRQAGASSACRRRRAGASITASPRSARPSRPTPPSATRRSRLRSPIRRSRARIRSARSSSSGSRFSTCRRSIPAPGATACASHRGRRQRPRGIHALPVGDQRRARSRVGLRHRARHAARAGHPMAAVGDPVKVATVDRGSGEVTLDAANALSPVSGRRAGARGPLARIPAHGLLCGPDPAAPSAPSRWRRSRCSATCRWIRGTAGTSRRSSATSTARRASPIAGRKANPGTSACTTGAGPGRAQRARQRCRACGSGPRRSSTCCPRPHPRRAPRARRRRRLDRDAHATTTTSAPTTPSRRTAPACSRLRNVEDISIVAVPGPHGAGDAGRADRPLRADALPLRRARRPAAAGTTPSPTSRPSGSSSTPSTPRSTTRGC